MGLNNTQTSVNLLTATESAARDWGIAALSTHGEDSGRHSLAKTRLCLQLYLLIPDRDPTTDQSKDMTRVQIGKPRNFLGATWGYFQQYQ